MLHYHGTPITPREKLETMKGLCFCVSHADPRDADWCEENAQSVLWDNGAFSAHTRGRPMSPDAFAAWVAPRLRHPHFAVIPDVIGGDVGDQRGHIAAWTLSAQLSAPVWHLHLPLEWLVELASTWPRICFGSSAQFWDVRSSAWSRRMDEAFDALEVRGLRPWVHMLRAMHAVSNGPWPVASADSTNTARNFKRNGKAPYDMARSIDALQPPPRYEISFLR